MKRLTAALLIVLSATVAAGCSGSDSMPTSPSAPAPPVVAPPPPPPPAPIWTQSGTGANVFNKPATATRLRIIGEYPNRPGRSENFVVRCDGRLLVNVIVGTSAVADTARYDGTVLAGTCVTVEVVYANGVLWSLTEVR